MSFKVQPKQPSVTPEASTYRWRIPEWFPDLKDKHEILKKYHDEMLRCNKAINLISPNTIGHADLIHVTDSVLASRVIFEDSKANEVFDIGSGNGFPGFVFGLLYPNVSVKLVESDGRKAEFLRHMVSFCGSKNISVLEKNADSIGSESVSVAFCRGFAAVPKTLLLARKFLKVGGFIYHLKGTEWPLEIAEIPTQLCSFFRSGLVKEYSLPVGGVKLSVVRSERVSP